MRSGIHDNVPAFPQVTRGRAPMSLPRTTLPRRHAGPPSALRGRRHPHLTRARRLGGSHHVRSHSSSARPACPSPVPEAPAAAAPEPKKGWFTRLPVWAKIVFVLIWPASVTYGVIVMWRDKKFSNGARIALTIGTVIFFVWVFMSDRRSRSGTPCLSPSTRPSSPQRPEAAQIQTAKATASAANP